MNQSKRYGWWAKLLILCVLIASTILAGLSGFRVYCGMSAGMTYREAMTPVSYENSRAAGEYLTNEMETMLASARVGKVSWKSDSEAAGHVYLFKTGEETNALFYLQDKSTDTVYTNVEEWVNLSLSEVRRDYETETYTSAQPDQNVYPEERNTCFYYRKVVENAGESTEFMLNEEASRIISEFIYSGEHDFYSTGNGMVELENANVFLALNTNYPLMNTQSYQDQAFYEWYRTSNTGWYLWYFYAAVAAFMLVLVGRQAGHSAKDGQIHTNGIERVPLELWILSDLILIIVSIGLGVTGIGNVDIYDADFEETYALSALLAVAGMLIFILTLAKMLCVYLRRIKARTLGSCAVYGACRMLRKFAREFYRTRRENTKLLIRYLLLLAVNVGLAFFTFLFFYAGMGVLTFLVVIAWIIADVYMLYALLKQTRGKDEIRNALREISNGNLDCQIDTSEMASEYRELAEDINHVRDGLRIAVDAQLKSEKLKTDLIANVSHDIKTPLTSIINYVDILKREHIEDERIARYIDILDKKSVRLKQLTDDLIEVSKISSGNITLELTEINLKQLMMQINGEFEEKFEKRNLQLICKLPDDPMRILADGRRMYRVVENLYSNAAKYAMPSSRIYVTGEIIDGKAVVSIKNMSEHPLNVSAEELLERFVRGDKSRTTEGNGLGLEIARSLTERQKGTFDLYLDGDLFKVTLAFDALGKR